jgi:2-oxo-4-hydroxy-4-carboxy-5-ureidoimidazoline decarboxylase
MDEFNALGPQDARAALALCCVSDNWISGVLAGRPYVSPAALIANATDVWSSLPAEDYLQAFEGHPKIGDVNSLRERYAASGDLAASEQAGVQGAQEDTIERLALGNDTYEDRYGYIFIVCASGKSAIDMCDLLDARLGNTPEVEIGIAAEEQRKIFTLRLEKML